MVATLLDPPSTLGPTEMRQFHRIIDSQIDRMHVLPYSVNLCFHIYMG